MERRHYKNTRTTKARAKNGKAKIGASLTSENGWVLGSRSRNGRRVSTNHGVNPRRRGEQREKPRGERWTDLGVLPILRAHGGACETRMGWTETRAGGKREERIRGQRMRKLRAQERGVSLSVSHSTFPRVLQKITACLLVMVL
jgi:hypothetical protein